MKLLIYIITFIMIAPNLLAKPVIKRTEFLRNTFVTIAVYDDRHEEVIDNCFALLHSLDDKLIQQTSLVDKELSPEIFYLIERGLYYSNLTKGAFDITIAPLSTLWQRGVPTNPEILAALNLVNYKNVFVNKAARTVTFQYENMQLDFNSIAKGYLTDLVCQELQMAGVEDALINIGGNIYVIGSKNIAIYIQDPFAHVGEAFAAVFLNNESMVTSEVYDQTYILNTKTGYPLVNNLASVSVIGINSLECDCLSTAAFAMGLEDGLNFIESLPATEAIFVTKDKKVFTTSGITLNIINPNYELH